MSSVKRIGHSWGEEIILTCGNSSRIVRIYSSHKKVTIDLSQVRDKTWDKYIKVNNKYPDCSTIVVPVSTDVSKVVNWWLA